MPPEELGRKHTCSNCSAKYYDLNKPDPVCPKCEVSLKDSNKASKAEKKSRARSGSRKAKKAKKGKAESEAASDG